MKTLWIVAKKELLDLFRDRRTMLISLLMGPLFGPALMVGLIHSWMLSPQAFDLVAVSQSAIRAQLAGLDLHPGV